MPKTHHLTAALLLLAAAAPAIAYERVEIRNKDVILGAITEHATTHEYLIDIPRDAIASLSLPKQKDSKLQGSMGLFSLTYRSERLILIGKRKIQRAAPPATSERFRAIVQGVNGSQGLYVLKPKIKVQKKYKIRGRRSDLSPPGQIIFGALPGYDVALKVTWAGPDPVTIGSFTGPDGSDVTSELPPKQKRSSFKHKGFRTTQFGDHVVVLDIPPSAKRWTLLVVQKAKSESRTLNLRAAQAEAPELDLQVAPGPWPLAIVNGEHGAANEIVLTANDTAPRVLGVLGGDPMNCGLAAIEPGNTPLHYGVVCDESHSALITVGERLPSRRIVDFVADPMDTPGGTGRATFSEFQYAGGNRLVGWTETRTFDASGNTHTLVFSELLNAGGTYSYTVVHTRPDGTTRRYDFLPFQ